jgi:hypothetical protein
MRKIIIVVLCVCLLISTACISVGSTRTTVNSTSTLSVVSTAIQSGLTTPPEAAADDIVFTAAGIGYRANVFGAVPNNWPPILEVYEDTGIGNNYARIEYRDYIETESGQTRNDIFNLSNVNDNGTSQVISNVIFAVANLPVGITANVTYSGSWNPGNNPMQIVSFEISNKIRPGYYGLNVDVQIDGQDYGTVPCTINVLAN